MNTFIFGHKKPDTDSICASISLAYLKNQLGIHAQAVTLGDINNETKYALNKFNIKTPKYLNDVKLQIKDIEYKKNCFVNEYESIYNSYNYMVNNKISGLPVIDDTKKLIGLVTLKEIAKELINGDFTYLSTSYQNILNTLKGKEVLKFDEEIKGNIKAASYRSTTILENIKLNSNDILIVGDRHSVLEYAINCKVKLIIVVGNGEITDKNLSLAKKNRINIIKTDLDTYHTTKLINLSNYIKNVMCENTPISFIDTDYYSDFIKTSEKLKHTNYPIINKKGECLGLLPITLSNNIKRKNVILVDHNEKEQSATGLEEANILEIIDHHKLVTMTTNTPINFRNMAVGSTNTIIYNLFKENNIEIPYSIAGAMLSGIISDTLLLKSPTTTEIDRKAVLELEKITNVDYYEYGMELFKAGSSLNGKTTEEIIFSDFKKFNYNDLKIGIGQIFTTDIDYIMKNKDEYINTLNKMDYFVIALFITDVINEGSYILYNDKSKELLEESYKINIYQGIYLDGFVSRKKQMIPPILETLEKA